MASEASLIAKGIGDRQVTPLLIVLSFILLTEGVVMVGVLGTREVVQVILCIFCVLFPVALMVPFLLILYHKPYVFYGPKEYGSDVGPERYISAMRAQASISGEWQKIFSDLPQMVARALASGPAASILEESARGTDISARLRSWAGGSASYSLRKSTKGKSSTLMLPILVEGRCKFLLSRA
jgi:hypothetical protein